MSAEKLFPMFLKLAARPCLVVGAGSVATSKIASLLEAGAKISVVAPESTPEVRKWVESGKLQLHRRAFQAQDLDGMFLVVAATPFRKVHEEIFREAKHRGVLCNIVDVPELCDFYYPSVVQRGALQIAVSTGGHSPALAQRLRKELEIQFGPEYQEWLVHLAEVRNRLQATEMDPEERKRLLHEEASSEAFAKFRSGRRRLESAS